MPRERDNKSSQVKSSRAKERKCLGARRAIEKAQLRTPAHTMTRGHKPTSLHGLTGSSSARSEDAPNYVTQTLKGAAPGRATGRECSQKFAFVTQAPEPFVNRHIQRIRAHTSSKSTTGVRRLPQSVMCYSRPFDACSTGLPSRACGGCACAGHAAIAVGANRA